MKVVRDWLRREAPRPVGRAWLERHALRSLPPGKVTEVPFLNSDGMNSEMSQLHIGKERFVLKRTPFDGKRHVDAAIQRWFEREVCFYRELAEFSPMRTPKSLAAVFHPPLLQLPSFLRDTLFGLRFRSAFGGGGFTLLLEDLNTADGQWNVASPDGVSLPQAMTVMRSLGSMHGRFRDSPEIASAEARWLPIMPSTIQFLPFMEPFVAKALTSVRSEFSVELAQVPGALRLAEGASQHYGALTRQLAAAPRTLVHGDFRPANMRFSQSDNEVIVYDWQFVSAGSGAFDIASFLALGMPAELRRSHESELIDVYLKHHHDATGTKQLSNASLMQDMRAAVLLELAVFIMGAASEGAGGNPLFRKIHAHGIQQLSVAASDWEAERALTSC
eukprot:6204403-Pleurochrysis_carterae.AAC.1